MLGCASSFNFCRKANSLNLIYTFYSVVNFTICQMTVPSFLLTATIVELCFYGLYYHEVHFFNNGVSLVLTDIMDLHLRLVLRRAHLSLELTGVLHLGIG